MKNTSKYKIVWILTLRLSLAYVFFAGKAARGGGTSYYSQVGSTNITKAKVTEILDENYEKTAYKDNEYMTDRIVLFTAKVTSGLKKGMEITAVQVIDSMYPVEQKQVRKGDRVLLAQNQYTQMSSVPYMFSEYYRLGFMAILGVLYGILLILMGKSKGVNTVISLTLTVGAVFWVFVPAVLNGKNIYVWRRSVTLFIIVMTVLFINNLSDKTYTAAIGCVRGTGVTAAITLAVCFGLHLSGMINQEAMYLLFLNEANPIDLKAVIFASVVFGAVGAVMDVAISLSSALAEVKENAPNIGAKQIFKSGMNIGKDMLGTMSNTLVLAYIGSSLSVTLLLFAYNSGNGTALMNTEMIIVRLLEALAGSFGILLTIPLTSFVCGIFYGSEEKENLQ